ncbi:MAG: hypothetical protein JST42_31200 [Bacteroidetes bacterium]|nr:hypothetical protein [Bacteroidota bacterium]
MSQQVDIERIQKFKEDRMTLPYDDIVIARRMKVDRSNYSKAVNAGPITNAFLRKFYAAFGDELKGGKEVAEPVEKEDILTRLDALQGLLVQVVELNELLTRQAALLVENTSLLAKDSQARIEKLLSRRDRKEG